jgi:hypothetical protein
MSTPLTTAAKDLSAYHSLVSLPVSAYKEVKSGFSSLSAECCIYLADKIRDIPTRDAARVELDRIFHNISREIIGGLAEEAISILIDENFPELKHDVRFRLFITMSLGLIKSEITGDVLHAILSPLIPGLAEKAAVAPYIAAMGFVFDVGVPALATAGASFVGSSVCAGAASLAGVCEAASAASSVVSVARTAGYAAGAVNVLATFCWSSSEGAKTKARIEKIIAKIIEKHGHRFSREEQVALSTINIEEHQPNLLLARLTEILLSERTTNIVQRLALAGGKGLLRGIQREAHHQVASYTSESVAGVVDSAASHVYGGAAAAASATASAIARASEGPSRPTPLIVTQAMDRASSAALTAKEFLAEAITNSAIEEISARLISNDKLDLLLDTVEMLVESNTLHRQIKAIIKAKAKKVLGNLPLVQEFKEVLSSIDQAKDVLILLKAGLSMLPISAATIHSMTTEINKIESIINALDSKLTTIRRIIRRIESDSDLNLEELLRDLETLQTEITGILESAYHSFHGVSSYVAGVLASNSHLIQQEFFNQFSNLHAVIISRLGSIPSFRFTSFDIASASVSGLGAASARISGAGAASSSLATLDFSEMRSVLEMNINRMIESIHLKSRILEGINAEILRAQSSIDRENLTASEEEQVRLLGLVEEQKAAILTMNKEFKQLNQQINKMFPTDARFFTLTEAFTSSFTVQERRLLDLNAGINHLNQMIDAQKPSALGSLFSGVYGYFGSRASAPVETPAKIETPSVASLSIYDCLADFYTRLTKKPTAKAAIEPAALSAGAASSTTALSSKAVLNRTIITELLKPENQALIRSKFPQIPGHVGKGPGELLIQLLLEVKKEGNFSEDNPRLRSIMSRLSSLDLSHL